MPCADLVVSHVHDKNKVRLSARFKIRAKVIWQEATSLSALVDYLPPRHVM